MQIFCQSTNTITISRNKEIETFANYCLLKERNEGLPLNSKTYSDIGLLLTEYDNKGLGQSGIWGNAAFDRNRLYSQWDENLVAALHHEPLQYYQVTEDLYYQKIQEVPLLAFQCFAYNQSLSCYKHSLHYISGEGNFFGGFNNSEGYYLLGLPRETIVTFQDRRYRNRRENTQMSTTVLELYQNN